MRENEEKMWKLKSNVISGVEINVVMTKVPVQKTIIKMFLFASCLTYCSFTTQFNDSATCLESRKRRRKLEVHKEQKKLTAKQQG